MTDKQILFSKLYAESLNGSQSARLAGYSSPRQSAYTLLQNPDVVALVADYRVDLLDFLTERIKNFSKNDIQSELKKIALSEKSKVGEKLRALEYLDKIENLEKAAETKDIEIIVRYE